MNHNELLQAIEIFMQKEQKDDNYNAGMVAVYQHIKNYTKEPEFTLSDEFKTFALEAFLNNDVTQLNKLESIIHLFTLINKNVTPLNNWYDGPNNLEPEMFSAFSDIFNGYSLSALNHDWDNEWFNLHVTFNKSVGQNFKYSFDSYGQFDKENFEENDSHKYEKLCSLLDIERYESLFLYINLSVAFNLIDENKVKEKISNLTQSKNPPFKLK